jgi:hypothetical protein
MSFKDKDWASRFDALGDEAEQKFEAYCKKRRRGFERFGHNRPNLRMDMLPARVRYTPDYLTSKCFVEVQGLGTDQLFKLKLDKHGALHYWNDMRSPHFEGVQFYVWDSYRKRECLLPLLVLDEVIGQCAELNAFPEGKAYFEIPADEVFDAA